MCLIQGLVTAIASHKMILLRLVDGPHPSGPSGRWKFHSDCHFPVTSYQPPQSKAHRSIYIESFQLPAKCQSRFHTNAHFLALWTTCSLANILGYCPREKGQLFFNEFKPKKSICMFKPKPIKLRRLDNTFFNILLNLLWFLVDK